MIQLTDKEKAEIIERIQNDKPLPAKYRATLFEDAKGVELIWKGKRNEVTNVVLPFQTIEQIDEPRDESHRPEYVDDLWSDPKTGRQVGGWTNKLIWGDNKLVLSSLKNGPMRREIENAGGLKLIYIDPPFDTGADFSFNVEVGDGESVTKQPSVLEEIAYRDTWGENGERYLQYIYERLILMRDLLHPAGSIYVHCDWRLNCHIRILLEEILGKFNLINQISWKRYAAHNLSQKRYDAITDTIIAFAVDWPENIFTPQFGITQECEMESRFPHIEAETGRRYQHVALEQASNASSKGEARYIAGRRVVSEVGWRWSQETFDERLRENPNLIHWTKAGRPRYKLYVDEYEGSPLGDIWTDIGYLSANDSQGVGYPTQKPEALLERIIKASSNEGDLVADFFCGSGTTLAVAEKLGRKWIGCDLGRFAIHTSRKRLIGVQRRLKAEGKPYRSFEILNLGKYERQYFVGINLSLPETEREKESRKKETEYVRLVLEAYKAQPVSQSPPFHGRKGKVMIVVGPIDAPVTQALVDEVVNGCLAQGLKMVDVLGFDFEMGLVPQAQN
ncbi:MAG TPA: site-specific DNA-methyltransferase, partial [bacterium]|nr:site-specific DNA-methyltransferase [bacterium]